MNKCAAFFGPPFSPLSLDWMLSRQRENKWTREWRQATTQTGAARAQAIYRFSLESIILQNSKTLFQREKKCRETATVMNFGFLLNGLVILFLDKLAQCSIPYDINAKNSSERKRNTVAQRWVLSQTLMICTNFFNPLIASQSLSFPNCKARGWGHLISCMSPPTVTFPIFVIPRRA